MFCISTFAVSWECSCSVPLLGKFWGHCKHMPGKLQNLEHLKCACSVPRFSPEFTRSGTLQEHSQDTANVLIWNIFGTSFWFFSNFLRLVHVRATLPYQILSVSLNLKISRRRSGCTIAHSSSLAAGSSGRCSYIT